MDYDEEYRYTPYNVMMNVSDVSKGTNKFYQMQILKVKGKERYFLFKRWGRVGVDDVGKLSKQSKVLILV